MSIPVEILQTASLLFFAVLFLIIKRYRPIGSLSILQNPISNRRNYSNTVSLRKKRKQIKRISNATYLIE